MKRWLLTVPLLFLAPISRGQTSTIQGWCETGNQAVITSGLTSSTQVQQSFPACTVTVFIHGAGVATIFADSSNTPLSNPFTATTNGRWLFYVASGRYDVQLSGAGFPSPVTYSDIFTSGSGGAPVIPGGSPIQTQVNNNGVFGGTPCESFSNILIGPENISCDWHAKGPNPYVDITQFGARTCNVSTTPCTAGITASINSGNTVATLSSASTFINGDGVVIYGAGSASGLATPAAPAVTNIIAQMGVGTDLTSPDVAVGATTKCYKIIARTTLGGYTPASPETCTNTGQATLGAVTVNLTSCTRSVATVTCTTASATPLLVGFALGGTPAPEVYIGGTAGTIDDSFRGWQLVTSAADSTHFTYIDQAINTNGGATTSTSGGTATFFVANHLSWTAVSNAWLYYIYGGATGAETLVGVSRPQNLVQGATYTTWDDFTNLMGSYVFPPWIPTTPPVSGANNNLSTTIVSGAGTTSITLANAAGATVSSVGIRLDATPAFIAAATAANTKGALFIPVDPNGAGQSFVVNSYCDLTSFNNMNVMQSGQLFLHETIAFRGFRFRYNGNILSSPGSAAVSWGNFPITTVAEAIPGIYLANAGQFSFSGVSFQTTVGNGVLEMLTDTATSLFNEYFEDVTWNTNSANNDFMSYGLIMRGQTGGPGGPSDIYMDRVGFLSGLQSGGQSHNGPFFCNTCGNTTIKNGFNLGSGIIFLGNTAGANLTIAADHYNGGFTPLVSIVNTKSVTLGDEGYPIVMDTVGESCVAAFGAVSVYNKGCSPSGANFASPSVTGGVVLAASSNTTNVGNSNNSLGASLQANVGLDGASKLVYNVLGPGGISTDYDDASIFVQSAPPTAPTCSVAAGGSAPIGNWRIFATPIWWNSHEGTPSLASNVCTTSSGNQTININWTIPPGNPKQMYITVGSSNNAAGSATCSSGCGAFATSTTSSTWNTAGTPSAPVLKGVPFGGPSSLLPGVQGISTPALTINGNCSSSAAPAVCGSSASGSVVVAAGATTVTVNTTAVTANSQVILTRDDSLGTKLGVTCNTATVMGEMKVSARVAGTSFTITVQTTPSTNPGCVSYLIVN